MRDIIDALRVIISEHQRETAEKTSTANISEPTLGRTMAFFFLVSFVGLLVIVPMRKVRRL